MEPVPRLDARCLARGRAAVCLRNCGLGKPGRGVPVRIRIRRIATRRQILATTINYSVENNPQDRMKCTLNIARPAFR